MDIVPLAPRPPRVPNARMGLLMTGVIAAGLALLGMRDIEWGLLKRSLRKAFPSVRWISTTELAQELANKNRRHPILLDVRTEAEWETSHLPDARRVEPKTWPEDVLAGTSKDAPIVTYCAVGYRSGDLAKQLSDAGYRNVRNLEGSIFQWANEHRPLVRGDERVTRVHPYNSWWGRLLEDDVRAQLPESTLSANGTPHS
ncbi:MAG: rhodanese-like domain-containing protein [Chthoniobacterales bacterium]